MRAVYRSVGWLGWAIVGLLLALWALSTIPIVGDTFTDWEQGFCNEGHFVSRRSIELVGEFNKLRIRVRNSSDFPKTVKPPLDSVSFMKALDTYSPALHSYDTFRFTRSGLDPWGRKLHYLVDEVSPWHFQVRIWSDGVNGRDENGNGDDVEQVFTKNYEENRKASIGDLSGKIE